MTEGPPRGGGRLGLVLELAKPRISLFVGLAAAFGFLLAPEPVPAGRLALLVVGIVLASGGAGALNHWAERDRDARMRRTRERPIPSGRVSPTAAAAIGVALSAIGSGLLAAGVNPLTGGVALATVLLYLFLYTPLKPRTSWNTLAGTIPGALPALAGWTAATGSIGWGGAAAVAILAAWQMPHALALAWIYRDDYARAGFRMLPAVDPTGRATARQIAGFAVVLAAVSLAPTALGLTGAIYTGGAFGLALWSVPPAFRFRKTRDDAAARRVLGISILWIPLLFAVLIVDRLIAGG